MMKTKLTLFVTVLAAALFGVGCMSQPDRLAVAGVYELTLGTSTSNKVFKPNGDYAAFNDGKIVGESSWLIKGGYIHVNPTNTKIRRTFSPDGKVTSEIHPQTAVYEINGDGGLTHVATVQNGEWGWLPSHLPNRKWRKVVRVQPID
jgi:hypothetical protein